MSKPTINEELVQALILALTYIQDIQALEEAGVKTGYKKGVVKRDLKIIENAIKKAQDE